MCLKIWNASASWNIVTDFVLMIVDVTIDRRHSSCLSGSAFCEVCWLGQNTEMAKTTFAISDNRPD
jgi:hypothetical protein